MKVYLHILRNLVWISCSPIAHQCIAVAGDVSTKQQTVKDREDRSSGAVKLKEWMNALGVTGP